MSFALSACANALFACKMIILQNCFALLPQGKAHIVKVHHLIIVITGLVNVGQSVKIRCVNPAHLYFQGR